MDIIVRIVCMILILVIGITLFDNFKLLIESNKGKKSIRLSGIDLYKPKIKAKNLLKVSSFFLMINHGPDLCKMDDKISNMPYYKGRCYLADLGDHNDKN